MRGRLTRARAQELLSFWFSRDALTGEQARNRLPEVVCVLRKRRRILGANSVHPANVALVGGRRFWIYRSLLDPAVATRAPDMIRTAFEALDAEFDGAPSSPIGLCLLLGCEERQQRPQAQWLEPPMVYAGYVRDGRQARIAYFHNALIAPREPSGPEPPARGDSPSQGDYRISVFADQDEVSGQDVVDLWTREAALSPAEAERRVAEVIAVAIAPEHRPAGVSTGYLTRSERLRADLWNIRVFVAEAHRVRHLGVALARAASGHLLERYASGTDRRGIGMLYEIESEIFKRALPHAVSPATKFTFIGDDARGSQVRVRYFPGALAPDPSGGTSLE